MRSDDPRVDARIAREAALTALPVTAAERQGVAVNVASFVGLGQVWKCVMGESHARPTPAQFEELNLFPPSVRAPLTELM